MAAKRVPLVPVYVKNRRVQFWHLEVDTESGAVRIGYELIGMPDNDTRDRLGETWYTPEEARTLVHRSIWESAESQFEELSRNSAATGGSPDLVDRRILYISFQEPCPVAATGSFLGFKWDFYARWDHWDFTLSTDSSVYPDGQIYRDMPTEEFPACIFFREVRYCPDDRWAAGYMSKSEMREFVRRCVREFQKERLSFGAS